MASRRRAKYLAGGGSSLMHRAALRTAGRPVSHFFDTDTESESDAASPLRLNDRKSVAPSAMYSDSELESPEKPPSAKRNTDTAESNPVSRLSQWTHLYDGFDSSPGASPAPPSNYSRNAQRNPAYLESDSDAAVTPGSTRTGHSAAVAPWSDNAAAVAAEVNMPSPTEPDQTTLIRYSHLLHEERRFRASELMSLQSLYWVTNPAGMPPCQIAAAFAGVPFRELHCRLHAQRLACRRGFQR